MEPTRKFLWDIEPPARQFQGLTLKMTVIRPTPGTREAQHPTWGQIKKLCQDAEKQVQQAQLPMTGPNLMAAMLALIAIASSDAQEKLSQI
ncbi:pyrin domain-containing protein 3-like [Choloepus didactylus]|uniref:pyrin domain-containing protein 3-like n=1 Tax=Choloepus didactylus TaxID=27675 RepID=UPI00189CD78A|nr:pyrin domain-containing protein 3-like [Choloepus didactylus]